MDKVSLDQLYNDQAAKELNLDLEEVDNISDLVMKEHQNLGIFSLTQIYAATNAREALSALQAYACTILYQERMKARKNAD